MGEIKKINRATGEVVGKFKVEFDEKKLLGEPYICVYEANKPRNPEGTTLVEYPLAGNLKAYVRFKLNQETEDAIREADTDYERTEGTCGSIVATKELLEHFELNESEIISRATANMVICGAEVVTMAEMLRRLSGVALMPDSCPVYVVRLKDELTPAHGAGILAINKLLDIVRERISDDFYILPSSIHEIICVSKSFSGPSVDDLREMVGIVNTQELSPEDKLSDDVFLYDENGLHIALA